MSDRTIVSDQVFDAHEVEMLSVIAAHVIPKNEARQMPSAAELNFLPSLVEDNEPYLAVLKEELGLVNARAGSVAFLQLSAAEQGQLLTQLREEHPGFLYRFAMHLYICYYQDARVLANIGLEARAPFPKGYTEYVKRGDLSLLDPVRARGRVYRPAE